MFTVGSRKIARFAVCLSVALTFIMMAVVVPPEVSAADNGIYTYNLIDGGAHVEITGYHGSSSILNVPSSIEGKPVTSLGWNCFSYRYDITEVSVPDTVINITASFVACWNLQFVHLGNNVTNILSGAFSDCRQLHNIDLPASVASIYSGSFYRDFSLLSINVDAANLNYSSQDGVLFNKLKTNLMSFPPAKLGSYDIPESVTSVSQYAFAYGSLTQVSISRNVSGLYVPGFSSSSKLLNISADAASTQYTSVDGVLYSKDRSVLWCFPGGRSGSFTVPEFVTSINQGAFNFNERLNSLDTGVNTTSIGDGALRYSQSLSSLIIGAKVNHIGSYAFTGSISLGSITVSGSNTAYRDVNGVLFTKDLFTLVAYPTARAGSYAVPSGVHMIGTGAFDYCEWLSAVTIPLGVSAIGEYGFGYCQNLTSVDLPNGLTSIGQNAFIESTALSNLTFPESLSVLGNQAFNRCIGLRTIIFEGNAPSCGAAVFGGHDPALIIYYHADATGFTNPWQGVTTSQMSVPDAPSNFTATAGKLQAQLNWTAPSDGNVSITGYTVYYGNGSVPDRIFGSYGPSTLSVNVTGLAAGTAYSFGVVAVNAMGNSSMATEIGVTPYGVPSPPVVLALTPGYENATISWTAGGNGGRPITGFTIYAGSSPESMFPLSAAGAAVRSATINGLTAGAQYYFGITESNLAGESNLSVLWTVTPYRVPGPPQNVTASAGQMQVALSWSAPLSDGGSGITSYKVYRQMAGGSQLIATCAAGVFSFTDSNVTAGTTYSYTISACNAAGANASALVTATPTAAPVDSSMTYMIIGLIIVIAAVVAIMLLLRRSKKI